MKLSTGWTGLLMPVCLFCAGAAHAAPSPPWSVVRDSHFEVYSQAGAESARSALPWFEQLRSFFVHSGLIPGGADRPPRPPVRVIGFSSEKEYRAYQLRTTADAFYLGTESRDYIVMPALGRRELSMAAHEYAHLVMHNGHPAIPLWMNEGLAEFFSTVRFEQDRCIVGGDLPMRSQTLARHAWLPLSSLLTLSPEAFARQTRDEVSIFYAESWALADMLMSSPDYAARFHMLVASLDSGTSSSTALTAVYLKSLPSVEADLARWVKQHRSVPLTLPVVEPAVLALETSTTLSDAQTTGLLADLLFSDGQVDRAEAMYRDIERTAPGNSVALAALGAIALRKGDRVEAGRNWEKAMDEGVADAQLCYRYAVLASQQNLAHPLIERALKRAITLQPEFDDARYQLALLQSNAGEFAAALAQLKAMHEPSHKRAFGYWSATAYVLTELDKRDEAGAAAQQALAHAETSAETSRARQLAYFASTDLKVQLAEGPDGRERLVQIRVPHGTTDFNPFVEPQDHILRAEGTLREVKCGAGKLTSFLVEAQNGLLELFVPNPARVLMKNSPSQFTCGAQPAGHVRVDYAALPNMLRGGLLRGMQFY